MGNDLEFLNRLYAVARDSYLGMQTFRENAYKTIEQFVGANVQPGAAAQIVPINFIKLFCNIYGRVLIPQNPKAMISSRFVGLRSVAADMEAWMNWRLDGMEIGKVFRRWVMSALVGLGVLEVGLSSSESFQYQNNTYYYGEPFACNVELDDYFVDMSARSWNSIAYEGHVFRMPLHAAMNDPEFDNVAEDGELVRSKLSADRIERSNTGGDDKVKSMETEGMNLYSLDYRDYTTLCQIFLHAEQLILTCRWEPHVGPTGLPLRVKEWQGPKLGPYKKLTFVDVPSMLLPCPPAADHMPLHTLENNIIRKLANQSDREKTLLLVGGGSTKDGKRIMKGKDGDVIRVDNPKDFQEVKFGGVDQSQLAFLLQVYQIFTRQAGNLETIGGLSAQAGTLGQEEILQSQSSAQLKDMQNVVVSAVKSVYEDMAWWWWTEPLRTYEGERTIKRISGTVPVKITPEMREGNFPKLNLSIDACSFQGSTPAEEVAKLDQFVQGILLPLMPAVQSQGGEFDIQQFLRIRSKLANMPYLDDLVKFQMPQGQEQPYAQPPKRDGGGGGPVQDGMMPMKPPQTTRTTIRRSVSQSGGNRDAAVIASLVGGGQPSDNQKANSL